MLIKPKDNTSILKLTSELSDLNNRYILQWLCEERERIRDAMEKEHNQPNFRQYQGASRILTTLIKFITEANDIRKVMK